MSGTGQVTAKPHAARVRAVKLWQSAQRGECAVADIAVYRARRKDRERAARRGASISTPTT
jgi:hypothetical protein